MIMRMLFALLGLVIAMTYAKPQSMLHPGFPPPSQPQHGHAPNQQPGYVPRSFGFHQDIDQLKAFQASNLNAASAQGSDTNYGKYADAQSAHGSDSAMSALRAKSKGNQSSKGAKFEHKESKAESWDDNQTWDDSIEALDAVDSQRTHAGAVDAENFSDAQRSKAKQSSSDVAAAEGHLEHSEGHRSK